MQLDRPIAALHHGFAFLGNERGVADPKQARIGWNARPLAIADQAVQWLAFGFCREIPQCDVDAEMANIVMP